MDSSKKNYFKKLIKSPNLISCLIASIMMALLVYVSDGYNFIGRILSMQLGFKLTIIALILLAVILLIVATFKGLKCKTLCFSDNILTFLCFGIILGIIYSFLTINSIFLTKVIVLACGIVFTLVLLVIRSKYFDCNKQVDKSSYEHVELSTYYKYLIKKYNIVILLFAVCAVALLVVANKTNMIMQLLTNKSLAPLTYSSILILGLIFVILLRSRVINKEVNSVDVVSLIGLVGSVALMIISFALKGKTATLALLFGIFALIVFILFTSILVSHTHFNTKQENQKLKDCDLKTYYSLFNHKSCILVLTAIAMILVAGLVLLDNINFATVIIQQIKGVNLKYLKVLALLGAGVVFAIMCVDIFTNKVGFIDNFLYILEVACILTVILFATLFKFAFYPKILFFIAIFLVCIFATSIRVKMVKVEEGEEAVCEEKQCCQKQVEVKVEEKVEEKPVAPKTEVVEQKVEEVVEESVATAEATAKSDVIVESVEETQVEENQAVEEVPDVKLKRVNVKKTFEIYLRTGDEQLKGNYSQIENAFLSYGLHSRMTRSRENLSKKGLSMSKANPEKALRLQAKILIRGKFIKLYLNLDPTTLDKKYYRHEDVSSKMPDQATYIKVRSKLTLKRALELIDKLAVQEGFKKKKKFEPVDYVKAFGDEHLTYMQKLGYDYLIKDTITKAEVALFKEEFAEKIVKTEVIGNPERYIYDEITLKELEDNFGDGGVATLEALRLKGLIKINANYLTVKCSDKLSKKLYVEANAFDKHVIEMIFLAGGEATRLIGE